MTDRDAFLQQAVRLVLACATREPMLRPIALDVQTHYARAGVRIGRAREDSNS